MYLKFFSTIILIFLSQAAFGQSLWKESSYGMTPEQVKSTFPTASKPDDPGTLHGGAIELLTVKDVEIINRKFDAAFFFKDGKLSQVTLQLQKGSTSAAAKLGYDSLREVLRSKYGQEIDSKSSSGFMSSATTTWMSGKTNIMLFYNKTGDLDPILSVIYQVRLSNEADKL